MGTATSTSSSTGSPRRPRSRSDVGLPLAYGPSWSPDGDRIAFIGSRSTGSPLIDTTVHGVYLMNSDGTDVRLLLEGFDDSGGLSFSPDGRWLAFPGRFGRREGEEQGLG